MIETCSKSESTNEVINVKGRKTKVFLCNRFVFLSFFFGFDGTIADLLLVTTVLILLLRNVNAYIRVKKRKTIYESHACLQYKFYL